jgi:hypothetical protein
MNSFGLKTWKGCLVMSDLLMKGKNSKGIWRFYMVTYAKGRKKFFVNTHDRRGNLICNQFFTFKEAYQFFQSLKLKRIYDD